MLPSIVFFLIYFVQLSPSSNHFTTHLPAVWSPDSCESYLCLSFEQPSPHFSFCCQIVFSFRSPSFFSFSQTLTVCSLPTLSLFLFSLVDIPSFFFFFFFLFLLQFSFCQFLVSTSVICPLFLLTRVSSCFCGFMI